MATLSLLAKITTEQLFGLLSQLSTEEKLEVSKALRAEARAERWKIHYLILDNEV